MNPLTHKLRLSFILLFIISCLSADPNTDSNTTTINDGPAEFFELRHLEDVSYNSTTASIPDDPQNPTIDDGSSVQYQLLDLEEVSYNSTASIPDDQNTTVNDGSAKPNDLKNAYSSFAAKLMNLTIFCDSTEPDLFHDLKTEDELDPGSWRPIFEPDSSYMGDKNMPAASEYYWGVLKMVTAVGSGQIRMMEEAAAEMEAAAKAGNPHAQSVMGFLYGLGQMREKNRLKAFLYHYLAAEGGNMESKMALAYMYLKQEKYDKSLKLYAELANVTLSNFLITKYLPVNHPISINDGAEENKANIKKFRGEEDEEFQVYKHLAQEGNNGAAMLRVGLYYYMGLRGVRRDWGKALGLFMGAVEKGEARAMEILGEMYVKGDGVEKNYSKAFEWFKLASEQQVYSAYNGLGYLYAKGYGVEQNYTQAKECFEKAGDNDGDYYVGQMYLKGVGVKKSSLSASARFLLASFGLHPKALYKWAETYHSNCSSLSQNASMAIKLYKNIAEQGPWSSLSRWAMEAYMKGDMGKAFLLFSRMGELGYEVAQSNAEWILETTSSDGDRSICMGEYGFCTDAEMQQRTHSMWLPHSF